MSFPTLTRSATLAVALLSAAPLLAAQGVPSPSQAQAILQSRPELATQLRQRLMTSGLSPEQVRARLKAEGYPENFLDGYLSGSGGGGTPSDDVLTAFRRLGLTDDEDSATLRTMLRQGATDGDSLPSKRARLVRDDSVTADASDSSAYQVFGLDVFQRATSQFLPTLDGPVDSNYRLGPGDQLVLILTGEVELAHTLDVSREGFIVIPQVGQMSVANLTMGQLESLLYTRLARSYSGIRRGADAPTRFSISVAKLRAIQVFVTGDVARPSSYRISSAATAMTALYAAGGPTETGSLRQVIVRRGGQTVATLDVYDYLLRGDNAKDVRLENGDVLFVPPHGPRVRVLGEVIRPATYELRAGEDVRDALRAAGGFKATARTARIQLSRIVPPAERGAGGQDRAIVDVTGSGAGIDALPAVEIRAGDELRVFPIADRIRNQVRIVGHVWSPGRQAYRPGLSLSEALRAAGGTKPDAYLGQVSISRLQNDSTRIQLRAMLRDTTGAAVDDLTLRDDDEITVYSLTEFRPERYVAIGGSVQHGGRFPWRDGMTLRDLVLMAGGLREGAYLREAEIARVPAARENGITAITLRVPLDSSFLTTASATALAQGPVLAPYDRVLIMQEPEFALPGSVVLAGEVRFPGRYALKSKTERLSDVVRRAGGLTSAAAPDGAYFARAKELTSFRADSTADSAAIQRAGGAFRAPDREVERARVGVDLIAALRRAGSPQDLILFDEDSLFVPVSRSTIQVEGAVNAPTVVTAAGRRSLDFYVRAGGGASLAGDARRAYVIQPNGTIEARRRVLAVIPITPRPRPGATVVVPARSTENRAQERIATAGLITQMVASIVTAYALLR